MKRTALVTVALAAALTLTPAAANAATPTAGHHYGASNYLGRWCDDMRTPKRCIANTDDGLLTVVNARGHYVTIGDEENAHRNIRLIVRFVTAHSHPCAEEGDDACTWDAHRQGNGYGKSYFVVSHRHPVVYYTGL